MKITKVTGIPLRWECEPISDALSTSEARQALLVRIDTDTDIYGIGEAFLYGAPLHVAKYVVERQLGGMITGKDPENQEELWNIMHWRTAAQRSRSVLMGAISGIDIALWDIKGKAEGKPISKLLGTSSDRVASYASGGFYASGKGIDGLKREIEKYLRMGYHDAKIKIGRNPERADNPLRYMANPVNGVSMEEDFKRIETAHELLGNGRLLVDMNASWTADMMLRYHDDLIGRGVSWVEEPIPFEDAVGYKKIQEVYRDASIIGFETEQGLANFTRHVKEGILDLVQPDIGWTGGFTECLKIGKMAEENGRKISLHSFGSAVHFAASLQLAAALPNSEMIESEENPNALKTDIMAAPFETDKNMSFLVPQKPGIGIDLDWEAIEKLIVEV